MQGLNAQFAASPQNGAQARSGVQSLDSLTLSVYETIRSSVLAREIAPGAKINQARLATQLNVSRTPVVQALHKLETQGLVDHVPERGFFVHQLTILELLDLYAVREAIEMITASELVDTCTDAQCSKLEDCFHPWLDGRPIEEAGRAEYFDADRRFHRLMLHLSTNNLAKRIDDQFQILNRSFIPGLLREPGETLAEHAGILEALRARDRELTAERVVRHVSATKDKLRDLVSRLRTLGIDPSTIPYAEFEPTDQGQQHGEPPSGDESCRPSAEEGGAKHDIVVDKNRTTDH